MPELSRFYGITIRMFFDDHRPPHFHAYYVGEQAIFQITTLSIIAGSLPPRALGLVIEWASLHRDELMDAWDKAERLEPLPRIPPLP
ncbi:MAG: DUF4160 domain-containing protein [Candidatus Bipolaricaulota bacterium]